jgi:thioredoxin reductase/polyferredoxin
MPGPRPVVNDQLESSVPGLFVVGDLAGAPVVKLAMEQGHRVAQHVAGLVDARATVAGAVDLIVIGAGAAGLSAAITAQQHGLRVLVLEKGTVGSTIADFPEGKWIYAEPESRPAPGQLWFQAATKEELLARWLECVNEHRLEVHAGEEVTAVRRRADHHFDVVTTEGAYCGRRVVLATGQRGHARQLGVEGEHRANIHHRLYSPKQYRGERIVVVGGGNTAVEAALSLAGDNHVTLCHRGQGFPRVFRENRRKLDAAVAAGRIRLALEAQVERFDEQMVTLRTPRGSETVAFDRAFVLIGAEAPKAFLKALGLRLENEWTGNPWLAGLLSAATVALLYWFAGKNLGFGLGALATLALLVATGVRGNRYSWLGVSTLVAYTIYGAKLGPGAEFFPYRGWGFQFFSLFDRPMSFWYTVAYTAVMTVFGIQAAKRWGFNRKDRFQQWRYASLLGFQWTFFFLVPEFLFQWAVRYQWVGAELAQDANFASNAWRAYGIVYAWPLFFYTFFGNPHEIWVIWGVLLSFVIIPVVVLFHGKRYCSWVCGCGGLAETLGDRWRHLAPKGRAAIQWEKMNAVVLAAAVVVTVLMLAQDVVQAFRAPAAFGITWYRLVVDVWLVGIIPVALYPFLGGKIWCRYWCPLAKMMELFSAWFTRWNRSRFAIYSNDKCIACGECTRYCQVGIDVMQFAMKQETLTNLNSSCIGCGICITVCPMAVLSFQPSPAPQLVQIRATR